MAKCRSKAVGKAATLPTAPAYTFGSRRIINEKEGTPGPGAYGDSLNCSCLNCGVGFGSSTRDEYKDNSAPGPNSYRPGTSQTLKAAPGYSFRPKPDGYSSFSRATPGPGQYDAGKAEPIVKPSTVAYSLAAKTEPAHPLHGNPGPDQYYPDRPSTSPAFTILTRHDQGSTFVAPGPGEYSPGDMRSASAGRTFGVSRGGGQRHNSGPSPGDYDPDVKPIRHSSQSWSIPKGYRGKSHLHDVPGPGQYAHDPIICHDAGFSPSSVSRSSPAYTMPSKYVSYGGRGTPGPGHYDPKNGTVLRAMPAFTLHGTSPKNFQAWSPGPGAYSPKDVYLRASAPSFTLFSKLNGGSGNSNTPGPATYYPRQSKKEGVSLKFRHPQKVDLSLPGPHEYANRDCQCSCCSNKGFTFGQRLVAQNALRTPGPEYKIGCSTLGVAACGPDHGHDLIL